MVTFWRFQRRHIGRLTKRKSYNNVVLKEQTHTDRGWGGEGDSDVLHWSGEVPDSTCDKKKEICWWKERVGSRETPRLRTMLRSLLSQPSNSMGRGSDSELRNFFRAVKIISVLSLFSCSWLFVIQTFTMEIPDWVEWVIPGSREILPDWFVRLDVVGEAIMWERMKRHNLTNRMGVKDKEENWIQH